MTRRSNVGSAPSRPSTSPAPTSGSLPYLAKGARHHPRSQMSEQLDGLLIHASERGDRATGPRPVRGGRRRSHDVHGAIVAPRTVRPSRQRRARSPRPSGTSLLKGCALATAVYPDPSWRPFGDVDLLLEPRRFAAGIAVLRAVGGVRHVPGGAAGTRHAGSPDVPVLRRGRPRPPPDADRRSLRAAHSRRGSSSTGAPERSRSAAARSACWTSSTPTFTPA